MCNKRLIAVNHGTRSFCALSLWNLFKLIKLGNVRTLLKLPVSSTPKAPLPRIMTSCNRRSPLTVIRDTRTSPKQLEPGETCVVGSGGGAERPRVPKWKPMTGPQGIRHGQQALCTLQRRDRIRELCITSPGRLGEFWVRGELNSIIQSITRNNFSSLLRCAGRGLIDPGIYYTDSPTE